MPITEQDLDYQPGTMVQNRRSGKVGVIPDLERLRRVRIPPVGKLLVEVTITSKKHPERRKVLREWLKRDTRPF